MVEKRLILLPTTGFIPLTEKHGGMPVGTDTPTNALVDVQSNSEEATALCALYAYEEYGFQPDDLSRYTTLTTSSAAESLTALFKKDVIGKTADGYYHALDDAPVAEYAETLQEGKPFRLDAGKKEYPNNISGTTLGYPEEDDEW
jgi:hypothetical protein